MPRALLEACSIIPRLGNRSVFILDPRLKILSTLGTGYFLKIAKLIPSKKNQFVLIAKIRSRKTQNIANPEKFRVTR